MNACRRLRLSGGIVPPEKSSGLSNPFHLTSISQNISRHSMRCILSLSQSISISTKRALGALKCRMVIGGRLTSNSIASNRTTTPCQTMCCGCLQSHVQLPQPVVAVYQAPSVNLWSAAITVIGWVVSAILEYIVLPGSNPHPFEHRLLHKIFDKASNVTYVERKSRTLPPQMIPTLAATIFH